jgi:hypothetical protein
VQPVGLIRLKKPWGKAPRQYIPISGKVIFSLSVGSLIVQRLENKKNHSHTLVGSAQLRWHHVMYMLLREPR